MDEDLKRNVEGDDGISIIRGSALWRDWNGIPVVAAVARSDASEWEHIVPYERSARP